MATGALDANGIWIYGEDDSEATFSALLNKLSDSTSDVVTTLKPAGRIVQQVTATASTQVTTTSTSYVTTGLSATITPRSSANKILILVHSAARTDQNGVSCYHALFRGTVAGTNLGTFGRHYFGSNVSNIVMFDIHTVDSPATTSATTYTLGFRGDNAAQTVYTNADGNIAKMTLLEIAG